jgi:polyhydroxybutyrate depolymerase
MRTLGVALALLLVIAADASAAVRELRVRVGGELRTYWLFEPSAAPRQTVVMFHGGSSSGAGQASLSGFDALPDDLARRGLPARRVAVAGFSDGGFFAYRLACQRTSRLSAVVAVATTMIFRPCRPSRPVRVTSIWMEADRRVPVEGRGFLPGAADVSRFWRRANGCRLLTRGQTPLWTAERGRQCTAPYASLVIRGAGHGWPPVATELATAAFP